MSRFTFCNCPAGFSSDPERHAPDCPGRSGAGKPARWDAPATTLSPAHVEDEREAFEQRYPYVKGLGFDGTRYAKLHNGAWQVICEVEGNLQWNAWQARAALSAPSCPCQTDTARETRRKDGIEAAELQGILLRDHQACRPRDAGLMGWAAAALSVPPAAGVPSAGSKVRCKKDLSNGQLKFSAGETYELKAVGDRIEVYNDAVGSYASMIFGCFLEHFEISYYAAPTPPASEQQQTVPRHKFEGLVEEVRLKDAEIDRLAERVRNLQAYHDGESGDGVWHWQGDGEDRLESLTCPIVIRAQDLRRIVASEQQRAVVMPERKRTWYCMGERPLSAADEAYNACIDEFLRLNPHLAKGEGV